MSKRAGGSLLKQNHQGSTMHLVTSNNHRDLEVIIAEIIRQQQLTNFEGAHVIIDGPSTISELVQVLLKLWRLSTICAVKWLTKTQQMQN